MVEGFHEENGSLKIDVGAEEKMNMGRSEKHGVPFSIHPQQIR